MRCSKLVVYNQNAIDTLFTECKFALLMYPGTGSVDKNSLKVDGNEK